MAVTPNPPKLISGAVGIDAARRAAALKASGGAPLMPPPPPAAPSAPAKHGPGKPSKEETARAAAFGLNVKDYRAALNAGTITEGNNPPPPPPAASVQTHVVAPPPANLVRGAGDIQAAIEAATAPLRKQIAEQQEALVKLKSKGGPAGVKREALFADRDTNVPEGDWRHLFHDYCSEGATLPLLPWRLARIGRSKDGDAIDNDEGYAPVKNPGPARVNAIIHVPSDSDPFRGTPCAGRDFGYIAVSTGVKGDLVTITEYMNYAEFASLLSWGDLEARGVPQEWIDAFKDALGYREPAAPQTRQMTPPQRSGGGPLPLHTNVWARLKAGDNKDYDYSAQIVEGLKNGTYTVRLVDTGDVMHVSASDIRAQ